MNDLPNFLRVNVEDYLFNDLTQMKSAQPIAGSLGGGLAYPLVMTVAAGIELLGALLYEDSAQPGVHCPFETRPNPGDKYFRYYWEKLLYPSRPNTRAECDAVFKAARHGIAHSYVLKGPVGIVKGQPADHLTGQGGTLLLDAAQLADDFINSYALRVKPLVSAMPAHPDATRMTQHLVEMAQEYGSQAASFLVPILGPISGVVQAGKLIPYLGTLPSHVSSSQWLYP